MFITKLDSRNYQFIVRTITIRAHLDITSLVDFKLECRQFSLILLSQANQNVQDQ